MLNPGPISVSTDQGKRNTKELKWKYEREKGYGVKKAQW